MPIQTPEITLGATPTVPKLRLGVQYLRRLLDMVPYNACMQCVGLVSKGSIQCFKFEELDILERGAWQPPGG
jgi:hypothetical protein